jgi:hypothetical protein
MAATVEVNLGLVFQDDELRIAETETGWRGFRRKDPPGEDDVRYYYVDTTSPHRSLREGVHVGEDAVRDTIEAGGIDR